MFPLLRISLFAAPSPISSHAAIANRAQVGDMGIDGQDALQEVSRAGREKNLEIIPITVKEILDEEVHYRV